MRLEARPTDWKKRLVGTPEVSGNRSGESVRAQERGRQSQVAWCHLRLTSKGGRRGSRIMTSKGIKEFRSWVTYLKYEKEKKRQDCKKGLKHRLWTTAAKGGRVAQGQRLTKKMYSPDKVRRVEALKGGRCHASNKASKMHQQTY